tara:strand:+ start:2142 stop:2714 length:573 start_codon:yes stop_codon:yes gene_type:complete
MAEKKKKKSIYSRKLKDVNKDGKRNFGDTWLGDLIGADGKAGIKKGRPGLKASIGGARREDGKADETAKAAKSTVKKKKKVISGGPKTRPKVNPTKKTTTVKKKAPARKAPSSFETPKKVTKKVNGPTKRPKLNTTKKVTGADWMKTHTYEDYMALSKSEARALGLPATRVAATQHPLRNQKFKGGKSFF